MVKMPFWIQKLYPKRIWSLTRNHPVLYLTFDDGPTPEITPWVLQELKKYNAKATFFCIGKNIEEHPDIFREVIKEGHTIGNHTHNHLNAKKFPLEEYLPNTKKAQEVIDSFAIQTHPFFRPPYGKLPSKYGSQLQKLGYRIVMWDVLSADFDPVITAEKCLKNVLNHAQNGSIIVFHDSAKASEKLKVVLPEVLEYFTMKGKKFESLS